MSDRSFREIRDAAESMSTSNLRYAPSIRAEVPKSAKLKMNETDQNTEQVITDVSGQEAVPAAELVQAIEVEVRRDPVFRERIAKLLDDVSYMEQPNQASEPNALQDTSDG